MADTLMLEIRDEGTLIPILAIRPGGEADSEAAQRLWARAGYGDGDHQNGFVLLAEVNGGKGQITCDPFDWPNRTLRLAHRYIHEHWFGLSDGDVVDVGIIMEQIEKRASEWR